MKVRFLPDNREYEFYQSKTILQAARELGLDADAPCGGRGKCGKCLVEADGRKTLACQTSLQDGM
ncbi:MAG: 2Fe-2S iron-sulfur cluster-binding protein, partial [Clostridiales bacterium]|nr:2Fe-2S iron-sulfur cluster-binding protein [Clostridiales bacterium]